MAEKFFDATGIRSERLLVVRHSHSKRYNNSKNVVQYWVCLCDCGKEIITPIHSVRNKTTKSCGCLKTERINRLRIERLSRNPRHGMSKTLEYKLWSSAKERAKKHGREFDLEISDVVVPEVCPVLGIPLFKGDGIMHAGSPQLDRVDNTRGYTKDNVRVISQRANAIKQNASIEMIEAILKYMKGEL